ncbi:MAG: dioxygenase [Betaproteobacteria bacterium]|jgi:aromatic ring-opening dioxygenase catalytic subunit (LigB family)|nr:dioxygenase [Betaproteobacteria bacterium]
MAAPRFPVLFISHGGGPWPYVDGLRQMYVKTERELRRLPARLPARPKAVLVISGHWETPKFSIATSARPPMEYDYVGFPPHTYQIRYTAPGDPDLAGHAHDLLGAAGIESTADANRGFDHGVFVPLGLMYPDADMPIVMVSVKSNYDPAEHLALGRALAPLREEGVLIVGSGLTYHNMRGFGRDEATPVAELFTRYLDDALAQTDVRARDERLLRWENAPAARLAHPREDHLMPLLTAAGAAGSDNGRVLFTETVMKVPMTSYVFGDVDLD